MYHGRKVGIINMFNEYVSFKKPVFRQWNSLGIETEILEDLKKRGVTLIKMQIFHTKPKTEGSQTTLTDVTVEEESTEKPVEEWLKASVDDFLSSDKKLKFKGIEQCHLTLTHLRANYK